MTLDFIELLKVVFLGIVEGVTGWLPISSTGHMLLVDEFITLNMSEAFKEMFFVVILLGAILAVVVLFWNKMFPFQFKNKVQPAIKKDTIQKAVNQLKNTAIEFGTVIRSVLAPIMMVLAERIQEFTT